MLTNPFFTADELRTLGLAFVCDAGVTDIEVLDGGIADQLFFERPYKRSIGPSFSNEDEAQMRVAVELIHHAVGAIPLRMSKSDEKVVRDLARRTLARLDEEARSQGHSSYQAKQL